MSQAGVVNVSGGGGSGTPIEKINVQTGTSPIVPTGNAVTINGATVTAGTHPVRTDGTGVSTMAVEVQISQAIASTDATKVGLAAFNSADFSVDANGFVSILMNAISYVQVTGPTTYTATATDYYISCDSTAGVITIKLPNAPTTLREFVIKDRTGQASINNINVTTVGGTVTIDGETTYIIDANDTAIGLLFNGTTFEVY